MIALLVAALMAVPPCQGDGHNRHRSHTAVAQFKRARPCPANGRRSGPCPGYVVDHVCALAQCGLDAPVNMQWQSDAESKAKDRIENTPEGARRWCSAKNRRRP